jgi:hypothetical protein
MLELKLRGQKKRDFSLTGCLLHMRVHSNPLYTEAPNLRA